MHCFSIFCCEDTSEDEDEESCRFDRGEGMVESSRSVSFVSEDGNGGVTDGVESSDRALCPWSMSRGELRKSGILFLPNNAGRRSRLTRVDEPFVCCWKPSGTVV